MEQKTVGPATRAAHGFYEPADVEAAYAEWGALCGPAALAALLGRELAGVRGYFADYRGYVNPRTMEAALVAGGWAARKAVPGPAVRAVDLWPCRGLVFLQIVGPWDAPGVPVRAAYRHTHWVACRNGPAGLWIYDVNGGAWSAQEDWAVQVMPAIVAGKPRATGWRVRLALHVGRPGVYNSPGIFTP
jgi:hypothetical protein